MRLVIELARLGFNLVWLLTLLIGEVMHAAARARGKLSQTRPEPRIELEFQPVAAAKSRNDNFK